MRAMRHRICSSTRTFGIGLCAGAALASIAAGAHAQSSESVQIYGLVGTYVSSLKRSDMPARQLLEGSGGLVTSYIGVRGSEDLGGGAKAIFALESFFQPDTGGMGRNSTDPLWSRNSYVGFSGGAGRLTFGRQTNPTYTAMGLVNPFGTSVVFSPLVLHTFVANYSGAVIGDTVWNNTVQYVTPDYKGLVGTAIYGLGEAAGHNGKGDLGLHLSYTGGGFTAVISGQRQRTSAVAPTVGQYTYLAGAAYDFKAAKVYAATAITQNVGVETGAHTYELGLSVPITAADSLLAEWARTRHSGGRPADQLRNTATLGWDHFLSRRTDVYATYMADRLSGSGLGNSFGVGIRHTF